MDLVSVPWVYRESIYMHLVSVLWVYRESMKQLYRGAHNLQKTETGIQGMGNVRRLVSSN